MKLIDRLNDATKNKFKNWEATETIIDKDKAFWELRKPGSTYQKVCMFRDGKDMVIYGDYGRYVFDNMTWLASPHNLQYDNLGYQMEKMDRDSHESVYEFDETTLANDLREWTKERLETRYEVAEEKAGRLADLVREGYGVENSDIRDILQDPTRHDIDEIASLLEFVDDALSSYPEDRAAWISFLRDNSDKVYEYDDVADSDLWKAGLELKTNFLVSLYAMQVCGEKLAEKPYEVFLEIKDQSASNRDLVITCSNEGEACSFLQFLYETEYHWPLKTDLLIDTEDLGANAYFLNGNSVVYEPITEKLLNPSVSSDDNLREKRVVPYSDIEEFVQEWLAEHQKDVLASDDLGERD